MASISFSGVTANWLPAASNRTYIHAYTGLGSCMYGDDGGADSQTERKTDARAGWMD